MPIGQIHHLASSPRWHRRTPTPDSELERGPSIVDDFKGPGTNNEVSIPILSGFLHASGKLLI